MKYFLFLFLTILLAGCGEAPYSHPDNLDNENEQIVNETQSNNNEEKTYESARFHGLDFRLGVEDVTVTGKAEAPNNEIYYVVEQGNEAIVEETKISLEDSQEDLSEFEVQFELTEEMEQNENTLVVLFYGKNDNGNKINENYLPIDMNLQFYNETNE